MAPLEINCGVGFPCQSSKNRCASGFPLRFGNFLSVMCLRYRNTGFEHTRFYIFKNNAARD